MLERGLVGRSACKVKAWTPESPRVLEGDGTGLLLGAPAFAEVTSGWKHSGPIAFSRSIGLAHECARPAISGRRDSRTVVVRAEFDQHHDIGRAASLRPGGAGEADVPVRDHVGQRGPRILRRDRVRVRGREELLPRRPHRRRICRLRTRSGETNNPSNEKDADHRVLLPHSIGQATTLPTGPSRLEPTLTCGQPGRLP